MHIMFPIGVVHCCPIRIPIGISSGFVMSMPWDVNLHCNHNQTVH